uniref:alpha/beta fold hydrolase n=1 Tax=Nocardioides stalactiti TaxID=2755356 RepID=UPI001C7ED8D9
AGLLPPLRGPASAVVELQYIRRHVMRMPSLPLDVARMIVSTNSEPYRLLWGRSESAVTGTLKDWDVRARLSEILVPALVTGGRYDEVTPAQVEALAAGLPTSERVIFEDSSHCAMWEEPDRFLSVVGDFLDRHDAR